MDDNFFQRLCMAIAARSPNGEITVDVEDFYGGGDMHLIFDPPLGGPNDPEPKSITISVADFVTRSELEDDLENSGS